MKRILLAGSIGCFALTTICGALTNLNAAGTDGKPTLAVKSEIALPGALNFTGWVATDLSKYNPDIKMMMSLPKTAKIVKTETGGLEIKVNEEYGLYVMKVDQESILYDKANIANKKMYDVGKILKEEPNGLIVTAQPKKLDGYDPYPTETHFIYYVNSGTTPTYRINDERPADNVATPETYYTEANAKTFLDFVKTSAKAK